MDENETQVEETTEETEEETQEETEQSTQTQKAQKPKRTDEEEYAHLEGRLKRLGKKLGKTDDEPAPSKPAKSEPLDLGGIAYLASMLGVKGKDEIALAREYVANGKSILDLPDNKYFKQDLEALREAKAAQDAVPSASKRATPSAKDSVDYWVTQPFSKVPQELKSKVIEARLQAEKHQPFK